ncbi:MAG: type IV toxin-antitoxin system AbiEi family antitoxin domain-containing protein [Chloroflexota bacterium]|nr:type IV toxin-antitoxin system AbiEi family antitoxin domain-containing protein [Chloroflexota bacterium]
MSTTLPISPASRMQMVGWRIVRLAERQFGVISRAQLLDCGLSSSGIARWVAAGRLHRVGCGVYAVGHRALSEEGRLAAALLRVGSGAALSHMTAAWWWGLLRFASTRIHISRIGRTRSSPGIEVHGPANLERVWHRGLPVTSVRQTLLEIAPIASEAAYRRAIAQADHLGLVNVEELRKETVTIKGCRRLHHALDHHLPQLAETRSPLEDRFLLFCEAHGIEMPEPNALVAGYQVDALFREARLAVELDGREVHGRPAAVVLDRRREMAIRGNEHRIVRYSDAQLEREPLTTAVDLRAELARRG